MTVLSHLVKSGWPGTRERSLPSSSRSFTLYFLFCGRGAMVVTRNSNFSRWKMRRNQDSRAPVASTNPEWLDRVFVTPIQRRSLLFSPRFKYQPKTEAMWFCRWLNLFRNNENGTTIQTTRNYRCSEPKGDDSCLFCVLKELNPNSKTTRWLYSKVEKRLVVGYRYRCLRYPSSLTRRARRERSYARRATREVFELKTTTRTRTWSGFYEQYEMVSCSSLWWSCSKIESFVAYWTWLI